MYTCKPSKSVYIPFEFRFLVNTIDVQDASTEVVGVAGNRCPSVGSCRLLPDDDIVVS